MPRPIQPCIRVVETLSKKDGYAEPKAKEQSEGARPEGAQAGSKARRDLRQQNTEASDSERRWTAVFCSRNGSALKSQTFLNSPRRLGAPRQRVLRRGSRLRPKHIQQPAGGTTLSLCPFPAESSLTLRFFVGESVKTPEPKHLSLSPPSRAAASA